MLKGFVFKLCLTHQFSHVNITVLTNPTELPVTVSISHGQVKMVVALVSLLPENLSIELVQKFWDWRGGGEAAT